MHLRPTALLLSVLLLPACSFDVDADGSKSASERYELVHSPGGGFETDLLLVNTHTGAVYERDGDRWTRLIKKVE